MLRCKNEEPQETREAMSMMDKTSLHVRARVQNVTYSSASMKRNDGVLLMPVVHNSKMASRRIIHIF